MFVKPSAVYWLLQVCLLECLAEDTGVPKNMSKLRLHQLPNIFDTVSSDPTDIHFYVYQNPKNLPHFQEVIINQTHTLKAAKITVGRVIILCESFDEKRGPTNGLKNEFLRRGYRNIVVINYDKLVQPQVPLPAGSIAYIAGLRNVRVIGKQGAGFINFLYQNGILNDGGKVHIIGFSIGAHVASAIGYELKKNYKMTIGRITGLDVAGPFANLLGKYKFHKNHANFVDAIHTDIDGFGTPEALGHADFYVNGGKGQAQAGCEGKGCKCNEIPSEVTPIICGEPRKCKYPTFVGQGSPTWARGKFYVKVTRSLENDTLITGPDVE